MAYASASDVLARLGTVLAADADSGQIEAFLTDAEAIIRARLPTLDADLLAGVMVMANVIAVEAGMVRRVLLNPDGYSQEAIDGWSGQRDVSLSAGLLFISPADWELLSVKIELRRRGSIRLVAYGETVYGAPYYPPVYR